MVDGRHVEAADRRETHEHHERAEVHVGAARRGCEVHVEEGAEPAGELFGGSRGLQGLCEGAVVRGWAQVEDLQAWEEVEEDNELPAGGCDGGLDVQTCGDGVDALVHVGCVVGGAGCGAVWF